MAIDVRVSKKFEDFTLEVSFGSKSKRIGILGASGCGKSLTLKSIAGIVKPDKGRISFEKLVFYDSDKRINVESAERKVGYLFQNYALFPNMTVEQNIKAALHGASADIVLKNFELTELKDHKPSQLSGGQQQRTALARMLASDPKLLLLDEPFSAMDTFLREGMRLELIKILERYDKTVIMVSHDRDEVYQMCSYLVLMDKGRVIEQGATDEVFSRPRSSVAARLTGCKNISRVERINEHRIRALDWKGLELVTDSRVSEKIRYAGIRAHDFTTADIGVNQIACGQAFISKLPFEWYVTLENGLWWKLARELYDGYDPSLIPEYISIAPDKILLMES